MSGRLLLKNGFVVDGSGKEGFTGDVLICGEKIEDVSARGISDTSSEVIDASGKIVSPGFIDCHSHSDAYLIIEPDAPSKISQGITTEVNGQCGGSIAPRYGQARLSSDWASLLGERLSWRSLGEYRAVLDNVKPALNTVQFVGHNTLRSSVVGYENRHATAEEIKKMQYLLEQAFDDGGAGLTTGLIYQPGKYADKTEVESLVRLASSKGGIYATHMRSESDELIESAKEVIDLCRAAGIKGVISHLKTYGPRNWHKVDELLDVVGAAVEEGVILGSDRYPYCAAGTDLDVVLPEWAQVGAAAAECVRLKNPEERIKIEDQLNASAHDWSRIMVGGTWSEKTGHASGRFISELGNPGKTVCEILENDLCRTGAFFFEMCEENLNRILSQQWVLPGSDASLRAPWGPLGRDHPHPRAYGTMPEFVKRLLSLGFSIEETVCRMTMRAAQRYNLRNRGIVRKGAYADIVVWEPGVFSSNAAYSSPHQFSSGVDCVVVNGSLTYRGGKFTGRRAGVFLERSV